VLSSELTAQSFFSVGGCLWSLVLAMVVFGVMSLGHFVQFLDENRAELEDVLCFFDDVDSLIGRE
jgi:hypothetical protein